MENQEIIKELNSKIEDLTKRSVKKINELKEEIEVIKINQLHSRSISKISEALSKAQSIMQIASKSSNGFKYSYADLTGYVKASRPALVKNGLSVTQLLSTINSTDYLVTILSHFSGEWFKSSFRVMVGNTLAKMSPEQKMGSALSYIKKYAYASIVGVVASEERDSDYTKEETKKIKKY